AVKSGRVYEVPSEPYCWLNNPPSVNQIMGVQWLPRLLYPDKFSTSIEDVTRSYYMTFYGYVLSDTELAELLAHAK
ncbi:MAG: ABC transporter substrate-binding protein, partial [Coriobacteriales bacterium]|nr:ABC transporter substrate-binding protein [Coriobacteriales bacterium]